MLAGEGLHPKATDDMVPGGRSKPQKKNGNQRLRAKLRDMIRMVFEKGGDVEGGRREAWEGADHRRTGGGI